MGKWMVALSFIATGCTAQSGIVTLGQDQYFVSRQAATGFSGLGTLKADALSQAGAHCAAQQREVLVTSEKETQPPYILGNFPRIEIKFSCVKANP